MAFLNRRRKGGFMRRLRMTQQGALSEQFSAPSGSIDTTDGALELRRRYAISEHLKAEAKKVRSKEFKERIRQLTKKTTRI